MYICKNNNHTHQNDKQPCKKRVITTTSISKITKSCVKNNNSNNKKKLTRDHTKVCEFIQ